MRQGDSYIAGEVSPSRAYGPPFVSVMPGGEGPTNQFNTAGSKGVGTTPGPQLSSHDDTVSRLRRPTQSL
jgi:hypothetical protein